MMDNNMKILMQNIAENSGFSKMKWKNVFLMDTCENLFV